MMSQKPIPTFDFVDLTDPSKNHQLLKDMAIACEQWGFFKIVNHGLEDRFSQSILQQMINFFDLSTEAKQSIKKHANQPWGFYDQELTKNRKDWKEIFDFNLHEADDHSIWSTQTPDFKPVMSNWYRSCEGISERLLQCFSEILADNRDHLAANFKGNNSSFLRLNYYPQLPDTTSLENLNGESDEKNKPLGISEHTDAGALTILAQDDVASLQVLRDGKWTTIEPEKNAFIINIGDMIQVWSNDRFKAPPHRVLTNNSSARYSAAFFYNPLYQSVCEPLVKSGPRYRPVHWGEFRAARANGDYADHGEENQISDYRI
jgi:isopenicillin N synthase-like dioxygenase